MNYASKVTISLLLATAASGCAMFDDERGERTEAYPVGSRLPVELVDTSGMPVGTAILKQAPGGVLMDVELRNISPGWHAIHVHETGRCDGPDFESAGGHFNPGDAMHGFVAEEGFHAGDLPNFFVGQNGRAQFDMFADYVSISGDDDALFDRDGAALVVHARDDDYRSQPAGNAGKRIACGVIRG